MERYKGRSPKESGGEKRPRRGVFDATGNADCVAEGETTTERRDTQRRRRGEMVDG